MWSIPRLPKRKITMRFTIRDLFLLTLVVAISLGWLVDHWRAAARDAEWERQFQEAVEKLSAADWKEHFFEAPTGPISVNRLPDGERIIATPPG